MAPRPVIEERIVRLADELAPYGITGFGAFRAWLTATSPALDAWAREAPRHRDDHPILEFRAPLSVHAATAFRNRTALEGLDAEPRVRALRTASGARRPGARWPRRRPPLSPESGLGAGDLAREAVAARSRVNPKRRRRRRARRPRERAGRKRARPRLRAALAAADGGAESLVLIVALARLLLRAGQPEDAAVGAGGWTGRARRRPRGAAAGGRRSRWSAATRTPRRRSC